MRHEKNRNCRKEDENIRRSPPEGRLCPVVEQRQEVEEAKDNSGMESTDKHGEQQRRRIHLQLYTRAIGGSGCFLFHSGSIARMGICPKRIVASGKSPRPSGGKANPRVTTTPITGSNTIWLTITALPRTKSRKGRASDDLPSVIIKSSIAARMIKDHFYRICNIAESARIECGAGVVGVVVDREEDKAGRCERMSRRAAFSMLN